MPSRFFFVSIIYFSAIGLALIASAILFFRLRRFDFKLPEGWKNSASSKNFRLSICFLTAFLLTVLMSESIAVYLANHHTYNSYIYSIYFTISTPLLFGFLYIHTHTSWKRFSYFILYFILIFYLISGDYFDPDCVHPGETILLQNSIYFLAALLHLTDLLLRPKSNHFRFQLKFNLILLIWSLLTTIIATFLWSEIKVIDPVFSDLIFLVNLSNIILFYLSLAFIFITETLYLHRKY